jgi:hypothetical protein
MSVLPQNKPTDYQRTADRLDAKGREALVVLFAAVRNDWQAPSSN